MAVKLEETVPVDVRLRQLLMVFQVSITLVCGLCGICATSLLQLVLRLLCESVKSRF
jgi:hypothetical protein